MLLGALVDAGVPLEVLQSTIHSLGLPEVTLTAGKVDKRGITATRVDVSAPSSDHHRHLPEIERIITASALPPAVKDRAVAVFQMLAAGLHELGVSTVSCRALPMSHGTVRCEHGLLPVPAPAVLRLMQGLPTEPLDVAGETLTPTAAAILRTMVTQWGSAPPMTLRRQGHGAGRKDFPRANVMRLLAGETSRESDIEPLTVLSTNVDDMNPEWLPAVVDRLLGAGARDVWLTPILMKKGRPAHTLSVLADPALTASLRDLVFAHTTSLGIREERVDRHRLPRRSVTVDTVWGPVRVKIAVLPDGGERVSPEFEDCRRISDAHDVPLSTVYQAALAARLSDGGQPP